MNMKEFKHIDATSIADAAAQLNKYGGKAAVIAGGTDLLGVIKSDIIPDFPQAVINLKTITPSLDYIKEEAGVLKIGALTTLATIAGNATVKGGYSLLSNAALSVAAATLRSMGTIGGNLCERVRCWYFRYPNEMGGRIFCFRKGGQLCFAVPGDNRWHSILAGQVCFAPFPSDTAVAISALNGKIVTNKRTIGIDDFYIVLGNTLAQDEFVTEVQIPKPAATVKQYWYKMRYRRAIDWALVSVATAIDVQNGTVASSRITLGAVAPVPYRATGAEDAIKGKAISDTVATAAGKAAVADAFPLNANPPKSPGNSYKVQIANTLVKRAILA
jgi:xanthine dehydrogenase YagS FAD-binding subunit